MSVGHVFLRAWMSRTRSPRAIHSATGSFWHAIMHRREGDFINSKYWYARYRGHPAHARVAELARPLFEGLASTVIAKPFSSGDWDGSALVDLAEEAHRRPKDDAVHRLAVALQRLE